VAVPKAGHDIVVTANFLLRLAEGAQGKALVDERLGDSLAQGGFSGRAEAATTSS